MVALVTTSGSLFGGCGGTLVASKYVISAAHCMFYYHANGTIVPLQITDIKVWNPSPPK